MIDPTSLNDCLEGLREAVGEPLELLDVAPIGGGDINTALRLTTTRGEWFVKLNRPGRMSMLQAEAFGLERLGQAKRLRVPKVVACGAGSHNAYLVLEWLNLRPLDDRGMARLGAQLADLHRVTEQQFGWGRDNTIGTTPQANRWETDWVAFFRERRLAPMLVSVEGINPALAELGRPVMARIERLFDHYRPVPSLLHGDLWQGNVSMDERGAPVIFDPAIYFGDRETDLAMTELFGGLSPAFYAEYQKAWPLDEGYARRRDLYQLYHILNHVILFGSAYVTSAHRLLQRLLAEVE